jgi:hypothetical protein
MKNIWKKYKWDGLVLLLLLLASLISLFVVLYRPQSSSLKASIYHHNEVVQVVDLSKENEERTFKIEGDKTSLTIGVKHNAIAILESGCPKQFCVHEGYVSEAGKPIVCAYNAIMIEIASNSSLDVEI